MGLDRIIRSFLSTGDGLSNRVVSEDFIKHEFTHHPESSGLYVLLPPWHGNLDESAVLARKLIKSGYSCLSYEFQPEVLSADHESTERCFKTIEETVRSDLEAYQKQYGFSEVNLIGTSLGSVNALMVANDNPPVNKVILVTPGHCLAESLWKGIMTQNMRIAFENSGVSMEELKQYWKELAPENNIGGLEGKDLYVHISQTDDVVPYFSGKKLVEAMKRLGLNPNVRENKYRGHYLTNAMFFLFPKNIS